MKMKAYIKYYLFYAAIFLIGASISAGLFFAYGAKLFPCEAFDISEEFSFSDAIGLASVVLKPLTLVFLAAFTLYACAIGGAVCLYVGAIFGRLTMCYCISEHIAFTHAASLLLTVFFGAVFVIMAKEATLLRGAMRYAAPDPSSIIKARSSISMFKTYLSCAGASMAVAMGTYMLILYFRL